MRSAWPIRWAMALRWSVIVLGSAILLTLFGRIRFNHSCLVRIVRRVGVCHDERGEANGFAYTTGSSSCFCRSIAAENTVPGASVHHAILRPRHGNDENEKADRIIQRKEVRCGKNQGLLYKATG